MRKKPKIFLAVAAAVLSVIAGSGAFALAAPATENRIRSRKIIPSATKRALKSPPV